MISSISLYILLVRMLNLFSYTSHVCVSYTPGLASAITIGSALNVIITALGNDKDLVFIDFQMFLRLEGRN